MDISPELIAKYVRRELTDPMDVIAVENELWIDLPFSFYPNVNDTIHFMLVLDDVMRKIDKIEEELKS